MSKPLNNTLSVKRNIKHFDFSDPYWEGTKQKKLVLQCCKATGKFQHFPRPVSIFTGRRRDIEWKEVSGKGTVYSYTITERGTPAFRGAGALCHRQRDARCGRQLHRQHCELHCGGAESRHEGEAVLAPAR